MRKVESDEGFTLVEVVVAMFILAIVATSVAAILVQALRVTGDNGRRTAAANLASEQIEQIRAQRAVDIADTAATTTTLNGTTYSITQDSAYQASDSAASICTATGTKVASKRVTISVTWPQMGQAKPVQVSTLVSLGLGQNGLSTAKAISAVYVQSAANTPQSGVPVTLTPGGTVKTTGSDGCAVFTDLDPTGSYFATVNQSGFVDEFGVQNPTKPINVQGAGTVGRTVLNYDRAALLTTTYAAPPTYSTSALTPLDPGTYLQFSKWSSADYKATPTATQRTLFPGTYFGWAGQCSKGQAPVDGNGTSGSASTPLVAGGSGTLALPLGGIVVKAGNGAASANATVYAKQILTGSNSGCPTGQQIAVQLDATGRAAVALPLGTWTFQKTPTSTNGTPANPVVTALAATNPAAPNVTVNMS